ncbi:pyocin knob domain-containing protein [Aerococcaceae bacterium NML160702]|nr:pyocin knob domain-containing protein [Aerococcaceae bacterium NML160702]
MAYFTQPVITNVGRSNLLKDGLTITRVAFGLGYSSSPVTQTRLNQETFSVSNAVLVREAAHLVISCVTDNQLLNLTSSRTIKEIGIYARIGSGSEFLLAYSYYSQGDTIPSKTEAHYQRDWQFRLGMSNANISSISYSVSTSGYASAGIVNSVSQRLTTHENDTTKHLTADERRKIIEAINLVKPMNGQYTNLTCPNGTNLATFMKRSTVPIGHGVVRDENTYRNMIYVKESANYIFGIATRYNRLWTWTVENGADKGYKEVTDYIAEHFTGNPDTLGEAGVYYLSNSSLTGTYGFLEVISNGQASLGQQQNWTLQRWTSTAGEHYIRVRANTAAWTAWRKSGW